jgi:hypothetical protein
MSAIFAIGLGIYMAGHGIRGIANGGLLGSVMMIVGGILVILTVAI